MIFEFGMVVVIATGRPPDIEGFCLGAALGADVEREAAVRPGFPVPDFCKTGIGLLVVWGQGLALV